MAASVLQPGVYPGSRPGGSEDKRVAADLRKEANDLYAAAKYDDALSTYGGRGINRSGPRYRRGYVDIPWRPVAATPRPRRGHSAEASITPQVLALRARGSDGPRPRAGREPNRAVPSRCSFFLCDA